MTPCEQALNAVEELAEGKAVSREVAAHLQACDRCAAALGRARQLHRALETWPAPMPPPDFTAKVLARTHTLQWRSEERFDWWFNAVTVVSLGLIALGVWGLLNLTGLNAVTLGTADFLGRTVPALYEQVRPRLSLYLTATGLIAASLAIWWWLERTDGSQRAA